MSGRNAKPISLHLAEGNPNRLTKEQIRQRQQSEVKLGEQDLKKLKKPSFISKDKIANKLWNDLIKEYQSAAEQGVELLTSSDVGTLALYCKTYSEYEYLVEARQKITNIEIDGWELEDYLDQVEDPDSSGYRALQYLSQLASVEGVLKIENAINKKMDMLLKLQDRLFLNPLAKVKNVPKQKKEEKAPSKFAKFGGGRSG